MVFIFSSNSSRGGLLLGVIFAKTPVANNILGSGNDVWNHYNGVEATLDTKGIKEYWVNCSTHEVVFSRPSSENINDMGAPSQSFIYSLASGDSRLISKKRQELSFENASDLSKVIKGFRDGYSSAVIVDTDSTGGSHALKVTSSGTTLSFTLNDNYLTAVFSDPNVKALAFDAKGEISVLNSFRYRTYKGGTATVPQFIGSPRLDTHWRTYYIPRSFYDDSYDVSSASNKNQYQVAWSDIGAGKYILFDRFRPVTVADEMALLGFESYAVDTSSGSSSYIRVSDGATGGNVMMYADVPDGAFDDQIFTEGTRSFRFTRTGGNDKKLAFHPNWLNANPLDDNDELIFDLRTSIALNKNLLFLGTNSSSTPTEALPEGATHPATTWVTYRLKWSEVKNGTIVRFPQRSEAQYAEITAWVDNIRIRKAADTGNYLSFERDMLEVTDRPYNGGKYIGINESTKVFRFNASNSATYAGVSYSMATDGSKSFHICREGSSEFALWLGNDLGTRVKNGETLKFDIYATNSGSISGGKYAVGDGNRASYTGGVLPTFQWVTIDIKASNLTSDYRFLCINNDAKGDFFLDNFRFAS